MRPATDPETAQTLHICPDCSSSLVQPTRWRQAGDRRHWRVWRRCPECEWTCDGVYGQAEIDAFDLQLVRATHVLADELRTLERANMSEMADAFVAGLSQDLIGADDFA